jgi:hypothetical protein
MTATVPFRFDARNHEYVDVATGAVLPHITGMLEQAGLVDDDWFTEESRIRGTAVHRLTADYDSGSLDPAKCISKYREYLLGHVAAMTILRGQGLEVHAIEEAIVHEIYRYGGRPDRIVTLSGRRGVLEIKTTAQPAKSHMVQTALQAMLDECESGLPAETLGRWCLYLRPKGKWKLEEHRSMRDFTEAQRVIRVCCR